MATEIAYSGEEAIDKFRKKILSGKGAFKLILTDINMPMMDGFQMSAEIQTIMEQMRIPSDKQSQIYAVTAMNDFQIKDRH
jgi:CheY-like chemotaxis protein